MGYSVAVPVKSQKAKEEMLAFLYKHYKPFSTLAQGTDLEQESRPEYDPTGAILADGELSYDNGKCRIGFDYGGMFRERHYLYCTIRWIALRVGRKRQLNAAAKLGILHAIYYYVYDGFEACPILRTTECTIEDAQKVGWTIVDQHGYDAWPRPWDLHPDGLVADAIAANDTHWLREKEIYATIDELVLKELTRLSRLWGERNG
jgi:hypothetical protein